MIAKVEPLTTARALRGPFDYALAGSLRERSESAAFSLVPFGRQRLRGVVVELAETSELPAERLAEPIAVLGEPLPSELVELGLWVARQYCSTPARGLELVLPPGGGKGVGARTELRAAVTEAGRAALGGAERLGPKQRAALERLLGARDSVAAGGDRDSFKRLEARGLVALTDEEVSAASRGRLRWAHGASDPS